MFGVGVQEMVLIGLLCLIVFGPSKMSGMARDLGGMVHKLRASVDEFKSEIDLEEDRDDFDEDFDELGRYAGSEPERLEGDVGSKKAPRTGETSVTEVWGSGEATGEGGLQDG